MLHTVLERHLAGSSCVLVREALVSEMVQDEAVVEKESQKSGVGRSSSLFSGVVCSSRKFETCGLFYFSAFPFGFLLWACAAGMVT